MNPILPPGASDPWMIHHNGWYYHAESTNQQRGISIRRSRTIADIGFAAGASVWDAPATGRNCHALRGPELHRFGNRWFIYYAADDGKDENHRMWALESEGDNPLGPYRCRGVIQTGGWAIDGTVLAQDDGRMFFVWSGWPGAKAGRQNLYIAPMKDPVATSGPRMLLCEPDEAWEQVGAPVCEAPQILRRNGDSFIVYSASGSFTPDHCLGLLHNRTGDLLNPAAWEKRGPVFQKTEQVWGVGHGCFVKSPCQTEDWIVYHSKSQRQHGWHDRDVHAKRFVWTAEGLPDFGTPPPRGRTKPVREADFSAPRMPMAA